MLTKIKRVLRLRLSNKEHRILGHKLVSYWGQKGDGYNWGGNGMASGGIYKIVEICKGEFEGHCWIEKVE